MGCAFEAERLLAEPRADASDAEIAALSRKACSIGDAPCLMAMTHLALSLERHPHLADELQKLAEHLCSRDEPMPCVVFAKTLGMGIGTRRDEEGAKALLDRLCSKGSRIACELAQQPIAAWRLVD